MEKNNLSSDGWLEKGLALYNSGNYEEALNCYDMALELESNFKNRNNLFNNKNLDSVNSLNLAS